MGKKYGKISRGIWEVTSKKDPRFNCSGSGKVGWLHMPYEATSKIKRVEEAHCISVPDDLILFYSKTKE